jgi:hypothetical protein
MGKCVSVEAIYAGERLNVDADAIYGVNGNSIGGCRREGRCRRHGPARSPAALPIVRWRKRIC